MKPDLVCLSPAGNLWLLLREIRREQPYLWPGSAWLNLETGELRELEHSVDELLDRGWVIFEGRQRQRELP